MSTLTTSELKDYLEMGYNCKEISTLFNTNVDEIRAVVRTLNLTSAMCKNRYVVYDKNDNFLCEGNSKQCAQALGIQMYSFLRNYSQLTKHGIGKKYKIYRINLEGKIIPPQQKHFRNSSKEKHFKEK